MAVYNQHRRQLQCTGDPRDPTTAFTEDLCSQLLQWQDRGDVIILALDGNQNLHTGPIARMLATVGLFDVQHTMHPDTPCVPTYKGGKNTIDGIFASSSLIIGNSGWLAFGENIGDHQVLWWDIPQTTLIGEEIYKIARPQVRRLNNDPCAQKKYCDKLETYFTNHKIQERLLKIQNQALDSSPTSTQHALDKIDSEITAYMLAAERRCRKLYMNNNPYSPTLSRSRWQIRYW